MSASHPALAARLAALDPAARARLRERLTQVRPPSLRPALTPGQRRLWNSAGHVVCQAVRLRGGVDLVALEARIDAFVRRHEALRTTFRTDGSTVRPVVHEELPPRVERLRCVGRQQAEAAAGALCDEPFDFATGPLLRVGLAEDLDAGHGWLLVAVPNLVFDAWSFELLLDWLAATEAPDAAPATPFSTFAADQARWVGSAEGGVAAAYWAGVVSDPPASLADAPDADTDRTGRRIAFSLPAELATELAVAARTEGATPFAGWLAVFGAALAELRGTSDVLVGTFTANRDRPGAGDVVGYLLNVLPVRLRVSDEADLQAWVRVARDETRAGLRHAAYPGELIEGAAPEAVFVFENLTRQERRIQGAEVETFDVSRGAARYDLTLSVQPGPNGVDGWLDFDPARYRERTVRHLADRFVALAGEVTAL